MVTDIYGGIEIRHPGAGTDWYDGEPWVKAMDLYPLLDDYGPASVDLPGAYPAYAFLFGARNHYGFEPIAAGRGLPDDLSGSLREDLQSSVTSGEMGDPSWVGWGELARLDLDGPLGHVVGCLWSNDGSSTCLTRLLPHGWRPESVAFAGPDAELAAAEPSRPATWTHAGLAYSYLPMTLATYFGDGTPWGHVLTVMRALAGRFGDDGVRLVTAFD